MTEKSWRDALGRHLGLDAGQRFEIYRTVAASSTLRDATYWAEILLSAGIATLGLTLGSPAVIIGAMLISPLMGPILSAGLALAAGDFVLAIRSVSAVLMSSLAAVAFSTLLVVLLPFREMTSEIAARTQPNTLDLIIALFSGAIGALAVSKSLRGVATSLPGVAIAVALMPPLCVTGYGVGLMLTVDRVQGLGVLRGGALLFVTNLVAITFASMLVFLALHIDSDEVRERVRSAPDLPDPTVLPPAMARVGSLPARLLMVAVMVAIVFLPLKRSFDALAKEIRTRRDLNAVQKEALSAWETLFGNTSTGQPRSYIDRFEAVERDGRLLLSVRVFTTESLTDDERRRYVQDVTRELRRPADSLDLSLVEIPTSQYRIATGKPDPKPEPGPAALGERLMSVAEEARRAARTVPLPPGMAVIGAEVSIAAAGPSVTLAYLAPQPLSPDAGALVVRSTRERLALPRADVRFVWLPSHATLRPLPRNGQLDPQSRTLLSQVSESLDRDPSLRVTIQGNSSDPETNVALVSSALQSLGVQPDRIAAQRSEAVAAGTVDLSLSVASSATAAQ